MGKNTLHLVGEMTTGTIVSREKLARDRIRTKLANVPLSLAGIEVNMGTHYVSRELGHDVSQPMPGCSGKRIRTISGTLTRSRKLCGAHRPAAFRN